MPVVRRLRSDEGDVLRATRLAALADAMPVVFHAATMVGPDLRIVARGVARDRF